MRSYPWSSGYTSAGSACWSAYRINSRELSFTVLKKEKNVGESKIAICKMDIQCSPVHLGIKPRHFQTIEEKMSVLL